MDAEVSSVIKLTEWAEMAEDRQVEFSPLLNGWVQVVLVDNGRRFVKSAPSIFHAGAGALAKWMNRK